VIICGRAGYEYDYFEDDEGKKQLEKTGIKMKAETEMGFEPSLLVFRFRSSHQFAAYSRANFGIKGTLAILMCSSAASDLKFLQEPAAN
jgi:hypothetical protein